MYIFFCSVQRVKIRFPCFIDKVLFVSIHPSPWWLLSRMRRLVCESSGKGTDYKIEACENTELKQHEVILKVKSCAFCKQAEYLVSFWNRDNYCANGFLISSFNKNSTTHVWRKGFNYIKYPPFNLIYSPEMILKCTNISKAVCTFLDLRI